MCYRIPVYEKRMPGFLDPTTESFEKDTVRENSSRLALCPACEGKRGVNGRSAPAGGARACQGLGEPADLKARKGQ